MVIVSGKVRGVEVLGFKFFEVSGVEYKEFLVGIALVLIFRDGISFLVCFFSSELIICLFCSFLVLRVVLVLFCGNSICLMLS